MTCVAQNQRGSLRSQDWVSIPPPLLVRVIGGVWIRLRR
jgi:hypothetical protein